MTHKRKSFKWVRTKVLFVGSAITLLFLLFGLQPHHFANSASLLPQQKTTKSGQQKNAQQDKKQDTVYSVVDENPTFPGGKDSLSKFITTNLKYPDDAKQNNIVGIILVTFVVEKDGSISNSNIKVVKSLTESCEREVVRVVKLMPKWKPGYIKGKAVRTKVEMPVEFSLRDDKPIEMRMDEDDW